MASTPKTSSATEIARSAARRDRVDIIAGGFAETGAIPVGATLPGMLEAGAAQSASRTEAADIKAIATPADLGRLVRAARERRHLSQQEFADLAGVGRRFLSELENGKPTLELGKVLRAAAAAGIDVFARER